MKRWLPGLLAAVCIAVLVVVSLRSSGPSEAPPATRESTDAGEERVSDEGETPAPATSGTASILGTVLRAGRRADARVEVRLLAGGDLLSLRAAGEPIVVVETEDGSFRIPLLVPGNYELRAFAEDGRLGRSVTRVRRAGAEVGATIHLPDGPHEWTGRLTLADGAAFSGWAYLKPLDDSFPHAVATAERTAADGALRLTGLHAGEYALVSRGHGVDAVERTSRDAIRIPMAMAEKPVVVVDAGCEEFAGTVVSEVDFSPIEGAVVVVCNSRWRGEVSARLTTDADGRFRLRSPLENWSLDVGAEGYAGCSLSGDEPWRDRRIRLAPLISVSGQVVDSDGGGPVPGVPVFLQNRSSDRPSGSGSTETLTGADGRYRFEAASPGEARLFARGAGWFSGTRRIDTTVTTEVVLRVEPAGRIRGRVTDGAGAGIPGVPVEVLESLPTLVQVTDAAGRFAFDGLEMGTMWRLRARPAGAGPTITDWVAAQAKPAETTILLAPEREIVVEVRDREDGTPVGGARLTLKTKNRYLKDTRSWVTGADGRAMLGGLPEARLGLKVNCEGYVPPAGPFVIRGAGESGTVRAFLTKGLAVSGCVHPPPGELREGGRVRLSREEGANPYALWHFKEYAPVQADGSFRFAGLSPGVYQLTVQTDLRGFKWLRREVQAGTEGLLLRLERKPEGSDQAEEAAAAEEERDAVPDLRLYVAGPDGRPVPRATVVIQSDEDWGYHRGEVVDGRVDVPMSKMRGDLYIQVSEARLTGGGRLPFGYRILTGIPVDIGEVRITLPPGNSVSGRVVDIDGAGVPGIKVSAYEEGGARQMWGHLSARGEAQTTWSGEDGGFRVERLPEGSVDLYVFPNGGYSAVSNPITVPAGTRSAVFRVKPIVKPELEITVTDEAGQPLTASRVRVWSLRKGSARRLSRVGPKPWRDGITDAKGIVRFPHPHAFEKYRLEVIPPASRPDLRTHSDYEWVPRDTEVRLGTGLFIRGRVKDGAGRPMPDAVVAWINREGRTVNPLWDGTFEIGPVGPEALTLFAIPRGRNVTLWLGAGVEVKPGADDVDLLYDPGRDLVVRIPNWPPPPSKHEGFRLGGAWTVLEGDRSGVEPQRQRVGDDGTVRFTDLGSTATVTVVVRAAPRNRCGLKRGVATNAGEVELVVTEGRRLYGTLSPPPDSYSASVSVRIAGLNFDGDVEEDATWEIPCLPEGEWEVEVGARVDGKRVTKRQRVHTGVETTISLR